MSLFYSNKWNFDLVGYVDVGFLSDPHKAKFQIGFLFTCGGIAISRRSVKQTITTTLLTHVEILAIHETSRECVWLMQ